MRRIWSGRSPTYSTSSPGTWRRRVVPPPKPTSRQPRSALISLRTHIARLAVTRPRVHPQLCALPLGLAPLGPAPLASQAAASRPGFELTRVADGVYAAIRSDSSVNIVHGNTTVIVNEQDVLVVDAAGTPAAARRVIAAVRRLSRKPVRYLVNTHWHDDHTMGN